MRTEFFTNKRTGCEYKRITKHQALMLYKDGHTLIIAPVNANMNYVTDIYKQ